MSDERRRQEKRDAERREYFDWLKDNKRDRWDAWDQANREPHPDSWK
jgi:hypothetical protein